MSVLRATVFEITYGFKEFCLLNMADKMAAFLEGALLFSSTFALATKYCCKLRLKFFKQLMSHPPDNCQN
ncbi:hypothetical protein BpHYR1_050193 [Brachionus plicatilis]|uniref:Uncharacterized protein n=1 Tax=Brachionus plicatilis TaxID=10195 RepID=A0A3M7QKR2_BRAPC|nr:hypothetical protein BpHYR1_050193 [Brachionus plicatilis]